MVKKTPPKSGMNGVSKDDGHIKADRGATLLVMPGQQWVEEFHRDLKEGVITKGVFVYTKDAPGEPRAEETFYRIVGGEFAGKLAGMALEAAVYIASHGVVLTSEEINREYDPDER